jgi:hypothetical protein
VIAPVRSSTFVLVAGLLLVAGRASAAPASCTEPYVRGQQLKNRGKLVPARVELQACVQACTGTFLVECKQWIQEVDRKLPTVVVRAESPSGEDLPRTRVSIDGVAVRAELDGKPIPIEIGSHMVRLEAEGFTPVEREIVGVEGEAGRILAVTLQPTAPAKPAGARLATTDTPPAPETGPRRPIPIPVFVLGGVALVGGVGFTLFGLQGNATRSDLESRNCAPRCPIDDADAMDRSYLFADIALGVGIAAAAAATVLFLLRPTVPN